MKKYLVAFVILLTMTSYGQKMSQRFDIKKYTQEQTDMIKTALNLNDATTDKVYKANLRKAYSVHKYIILSENRGTTTGKTMEDVIKAIKSEAERASGFHVAMKKILGNEKYKVFLEKFPK